MNEAVRAITVHWDDAVPSLPGWSCWWTTEGRDDFIDAGQAPDKDDCTITELSKAVEYSLAAMRSAGVEVPDITFDDFETQNYDARFCCGWSATWKAQGAWHGTITLFREERSNG